MIRERKVRAPQGKVSWRTGSPRGGESATENTRPRPQAGAKVKRRGKSSPLRGQLRRHGKPHLEQGQIEEERRPASWEGFALP
jgi:hypothetical protein